MIVHHARIDADRIVSGYLAAWNSPAADPRDRHLQATWGEAASFRDPLAELVGRSAMSAHIAAFRRDHPAARFVTRANVDQHHARFHFAWTLLDGAGDEMLAGRSVGEFDPGGRIAQLVVFFDQKAVRWTGAGRPMTASK